MKTGWVAAAAVGAVLLLVAVAYLRPAVMVKLADLVWSCIG